jgi:hypothetical protein
MVLASVRMTQPRIDNRTDYAAHPQVLLDRDGEKLAVIVKATFECASPSGGELEVAPKSRRRGIRFADVPWGEPEKSSIAYPADVCLRKPATDVVVVARAHAPGGRAVPFFDAYVEVGGLRKALRIHGLRVWEADGAGLSPPRPLTQLEVRYDFAWGGFDDSNPDKPAEEARNPVGVGIACHPKSLTDKAGPQIEDPAALIRNWRTKPTPAGVGVVGRHWEPRRGYAGTFDAKWKETRMPLLPDDHDDRFNQCASPGLIADPPLVGGEEVKLLNLIPGGGPTLFVLPRIRLEIEFRPPRGRPVRVSPHVDTVLLDLLALLPEQPIAVELVWRAHVPAPRELDKTQVIVRELAEPQA